MVRAAVLGIILPLAACGQPKENVACPTFSNGIIHSAPRSYAELNDNAKQCEMYFLTRYAPLPGPASEAVSAVMLECASQRGAAFKAGVEQNQVFDDEAAYDRDRRESLFTTVFQRRLHQCPIPPLAGK